jgi:hypothetical protein
MPEQPVDLQSSVPKLRLLQDLTAHKVYEIPFYSGPSERDFLLLELLQRIRREDPEWSRDDERLPMDQQPHAHKGNLMIIERRVWEKRRTEILKDMWRDVRGMSEEDALQSYRNTYTEDASTCFNRHQRPKMGCIDYKDESKRIGNPTAGGRGMRQALAHIAPIHLCDFCPVKSGYVQGEVFHERGYYN